MADFVWPVRVYYEDTDSGGVVYYANYLKFMERARTEWLRSLGYEQDTLIAEQGLIFAVKSVNVAYDRPARFNDSLRVSARVVERSRVSLTFEQEITREGEDKPLCTATVQIVCLDSTRFKPARLPELPE